MTLTRANVEAELIGRRGKSMVFAGLDGVVVDGTNQDLNNPIAYGIRQSDGSVASPSSVSDADVQTVAAVDEDKLYDFAEYRLMQSIADSLLTIYDWKTGPRSERAGQAAERMEKAIEKKEAELTNLYNFALGETTGGHVELSFAQHEDQDAPVD